MERGISIILANKLNDLEWYYTIPTQSSQTTYYNSLYFNTGGSDGTHDSGYLLQIRDILGTKVILLQVFTDSIYTPLVTASQALASGDSIGVQRIGGVFQLWYKASGGSWGTLGSTVSDNTWNSSNCFGTTFVDWSVYDATWDNFGGGTYVPPAATGGILTTNTGMWGAL